MIIRRVGPLSVAKVAGVIYGLIGFIIGAIVSLVSLVSTAFADSGGLAGMLFGVGAIIVLPIFYGFIGFVFTLIGSALYNLVAQWVGGIEFDAG